MKVALGNDHLGYALKASIARQLSGLGHEVVDLGTHDDSPIDYPDIAARVAHFVSDGSAERAILVCGTGLGMAIAANKVAGIRAASVSDPYSAERAIKSNNAQILCLGARVVSPEVAALLVSHWIESTFQGGDSARKVDKISALEKR